MKHSFSRDDDGVVRLDVCHLGRFVGLESVGDRISLRKPHFALEFPAHVDALVHLQGVVEDLRGVGSVDEVSFESG